MKMSISALLLLLSLLQSSQAQDSLYAALSIKPVNISLTAGLFLGPADPAVSFYPALGWNASIPIKYDFFHLDLNMQLASRHLLSPDFEYDFFYTNTISDSLWFYGHKTINNYRDVTIVLNVSPTVYFRRLFFGINNKIVISGSRYQETESKIDFTTHDTLKTTQGNFGGFDLNYAFFSGINIGYTFNRIAIVLLLNGYHKSSEMGIQVRYQIRPNQDLKRR